MGTLLNSIKNSYAAVVIATICRIFVGWEFLTAVWGKIFGPDAVNWIGSNAGGHVTEFLQTALTKTSGSHPDVQGFYAFFIKYISLPHAELFSYFTVLGELAAGIALLCGILTPLALLLGMLLNYNYLLAGTVSMNPVLILLETLLLWAGAASYKIGIDFFIMPKLKRVFNF